MSLGELEIYLRDHKLHARVFFAGKSWYAIFSRTESAREFTGSGVDLAEALASAREHVALRGT